MSGHRDTSGQHSAVLNLKAPHPKVPRGAEAGATQMECDGRDSGEVPSVRGGGGGVPAAKDVSETREVAAVQRSAKTECGDVGMWAVGVEEEERRMMRPEHK